MRFLPFLMYSDNYEQALTNTVISVLASHPHPLAVMACIAQFIAYDYLLFQHVQNVQNVDPKNVIKIVLGVLEKTYNSNIVQNILREDYIYSHRKDPENKTDKKHLEEFWDLLHHVDALSEVTDVQCNDVDFATLCSLGTQYEIEVKNLNVEESRSGTKIKDGKKVSVISNSGKSEAVELASTTLTSWFKVPEGNDSVTIRVKDQRSFLPGLQVHIDGHSFQISSVSTDPKPIYAKPLIDRKTGVPGTGLSAKSEQTAACALYFLKWSGNTSVYNNLKRCICFGGDTDSLAITVLPILLMTRDLDKHVTELFKTENGTWIVDKLEGLKYTNDRFEELVRLK